MNKLAFDPKKHRYARLRDGTVQPLCGESSIFYEDGDGKWYMECDKSIHPKIFRFCNTRHRIIEFLEERE